MQIESKLIPIIREGIDVVKMIFFQKLKAYLAEKYPGKEPSYANRLAGAIINELFGTPNTDAPFAAFTDENRTVIDEEMENIAKQFGELRIPLTDALRIQFLCDHQDGIDSSSVLRRAVKLNILIMDREVPMPAKFMTMARKLGGAFGILIPMTPAENN